MSILKNKRILVIGAGGLLGRSLVSGVVSAKGKVIAVDSNAESMRNGLELPKNIKRNIEFLVLDITNEEAMSNFFTSSLELDGAINAAYPRNQSYGAGFYDVSLESFNENLALQLGSTFLLTQQCASYFNLHKRPFSLVNLASIYGSVAPRFDIYEGTAMTMPVEYAAIKSATIHLSKYVARVVGDINFRINCLSPGGVLNAQDGNFVESYSKYSMSKTMLAPDDIVSTALFLLSDLAKHITGQNLIVDDGWHL